MFEYVSIFPSCPFQIWLDLVHGLLNQRWLCPANYPRFIPDAAEKSLPVFSASAMTLSDFAAQHCVFMFCVDTNVFSFDWYIRFPTLTCTSYYVFNPLKLWPWLPSGYTLMFAWGDAAFASMCVSIRFYHCPKVELVLSYVQGVLESTWNKMEQDAPREIQCGGTSGSDFLLWAALVYESFLSPKVFTPVLTFSSPRLVKPRIPAAIRSDTDLHHQDSGLGKDAFRPAEQSLNSCSLKWNV